MVPTGKVKLHHVRLNGMPWRAGRSVMAAAIANHSNGRSVRDCRGRWAGCAQ